MNKIIDIIGVPIDFGSNKRGVDMGPSAIRYSGLQDAIQNIGLEYRDLGNIPVILPEMDATHPHTKMKYLKEINAANRLLSEKVGESLEKGRFPLILGGDHSIGTGSVLGAQRVLKNIGVIWVDAHGDFNTEETTLSGNLHGMSLAAAAGVGAREMTPFFPAELSFVNPDKIVIIGVRSLDREEARLIKKTGVSVFTIEDIDMMGMAKVMEKAIEIVEKDTAGFHLSFDLDVITPSEAPGVGTPVEGGLTYREAHFAAEILSSRSKLCSMDFVELNPILDHANKTGMLAVSLISSVLGKRVFRVLDEV